MTFEKRMVKESMEKVKAILDLTPEQYCISRKIPLDHAQSKQFGGLQVEIGSLLFWLERSGFDNTETD